MVRAGYGVFFAQAFYPGWGGGMSLDGFNLRGVHFLATADQAPFGFLSNLGQQLDRRGASYRSRQFIFQRRKMVFKLLQGQAIAGARACRCLLARQLP